MKRIIKNLGLPLIIILGLGISMYFYTDSEKFGAADPSSQREIFNYVDTFDREGNPVTLYYFKGNKINKNLSDDGNVEIISDVKKKDKNGKDFREVTFNVFVKDSHIKINNEWFEVQASTTPRDQFVKPVASRFFKSAYAADFLGASDGYNRVDSSAVSWNAARTANGTANGVQWSIEWIGSTGAWTRYGRNKGLFDASSIDDTWIVTSATLTLNASRNDAGEPHSDCFSVTNHETDANASAEYQHWLTNSPVNWSNTSVCDADVVAGSDNVWTFNATGIAGISLTGVTGIALVLKADLDNSEPGGPGGNQRDWNGSTDGVGSACDTGQDPCLTVVASAPAVASDSGEGIIFQQ